MSGAGTLAGGAKAPKDRADYGPAGPSEERCGLCCHREPPNQCAVVAGPIDPDHRCKHYLAGEPLPPKPDCVVLGPDVDREKLLADLIEACGYHVIDLGKKRKEGRPHETATGLPTGDALRAGVEAMKDEARKKGVRLNQRSALRQILNATIGSKLAEEGASAREIESAIEDALPTLERRLRETNTPRRRK